MGEGTKIEWCDYTFNPWIGCTKVSPGCANCYAEALMDKRWGRVKWGKGQGREMTSAGNWDQPVNWNVQASRVKDVVGRQRVFCGSLCDWLDDEVQIEGLLALLNVIRETRYLDWLLLTKRPELFVPRLSRCVDRLANRLGGEALREELVAWLQGGSPKNVWFGVSVEDQERADERVPILQRIPAKVRFLSVEPMLGPIRLKSWEGVDWAILGGESGVGARPCDVGWIRSGVQQCQGSGVSVFVKQLGACPVNTHPLRGLPWVKHQSFPAGTIFDEGTGRYLLKDRKGGDMGEWPEDLRVREWPRMAESKWKMADGEWEEGSRGGAENAEWEGERVIRWNGKEQMEDGR